MKEFVVYTLARLALFVASYALVIGVYLLIAGTSHVPTLWPLVVALVISSVLSVYLLKGPRRRFAARIEQRATAARNRFEESRSKEDVD